MATQFKIITNLAGFEYCVPVSTPKDYFKQADIEYRAKSKDLADLGKRIHTQLKHDRSWPNPEMSGDSYLVAQGYQL